MQSLIRSCSATRLPLHLHLHRSRIVYRALATSTLSTTTTTPTPPPPPTSTNLFADTTATGVVSRPPQDHSSVNASENAVAPIEEQKGEGKADSKSAASAKAKRPRKPKKNDPEGPLRPQLNVPVSPEHGLWAFFRRVEEDKDNKGADADVDEDEVVYRALMPSNRKLDRSGRSWLAAELRRKSFKDLHTLWYVLLRERNLLATQKHEAARLGADIHKHTSIVQRTYRVSKSMARIKCVLNARRLAYEAAVELHQNNAPLVERKVAPLLEGSMFEETPDAEKKLEN